MPETVVGWARRRLMPFVAGFLLTSLVVLGAYGVFRLVQPDEPAPLPAAPTAVATPILVAVDTVGARPLPVHRPTVHAKHRSQPPPIQVHAPAVAEVVTAPPVELPQVSKPVSRKKEVRHEAPPPEVAESPVAVEPPPPPPVVEPPPPPIVAAVPPPVPAAPEPGRAARNHDASLTVSRVDMVSSYSGARPPQPGDCYAVVYLTLRDAPDTLQLSDGRFLLKDAAGAVYDPIGQYSTPLVVLMPGAELSGVLVFEVPLQSVPSQVAFGAINRSPLVVDLSRGPQ